MWLREPADAHAFAVAHAFVDDRRKALHGCPELRLLPKNVWGLPGDRLSVTAAGGYDSRYFGPAPLIARATPLPGSLVHGTILAALLFGAWLMARAR